MEKVRNLLKKELRLFEADHTGMPDYALESSGGSVLSTRCTVQYNERSRTQKLFGIPLWFTSYSPRTVIQRKGYGASAGECWAFYGGHGFLTIGLSDLINVTAVSYEHLPIELSPDGHISTAPKNFLVWSYQDIDDIYSRILLGNFTFDALGDPLQIFYVQHWDERLTNIIELETLTNWGSYVTCLYRFRVHGQALKILPEFSEESEQSNLSFSNVQAKSHERD
uniref:SUN domain-containing protein n=1 Tax=Meloidogyne incognita TaxID=6306 RepID=A0A914MQG4_MELIC